MNTQFSFPAVDKNKDIVISSRNPDLKNKYIPNKPPKPWSFLDIIGKIWALPTTIFGLALGVAGYVSAKIKGGNPSIDIGHNAIQFHNIPIFFNDNAAAITYGNTIAYGEGTTPESRGAYGNEHVDTGTHEEAHTYQYQKMGIFYAPAYFAEGGFSKSDDSDLNQFEQEANNYALNKHAHS